MKNVTFEALSAYQAPAFRAVSLGAGRTICDQSPYNPNIEPYDDENIDLDGGE